MFTDLVRRIGWVFLPLSLVAKLPFAMSVVAVMTSVSAVRGSFTLAGTTAALVGLGTAVSGPVFGSIADKYGQRPVLLVTALANAAAMTALAISLRVSAPVSFVLVAGLLIGLTAPQASSMIRARWLQMIAVEVEPARRSKATSAVLSYESMTDELMFVFGPVISGVVAMLLGVVVPLEFAAVLTAAGVIAFAFHPSARYVTGSRRPVPAGSNPSGSGTAEASAGTPDPLGEGAVPGHAADASADTSAPAAHMAPFSEVLRLRIMLPVAGMTAIGFFFGSTLTSLTAFMETLGRADETGIFYGVMGVGSAIFALGVVLLPERFSFVARWITFGCLALIGSLLLVAAPTMTMAIPSLVVMGCGIGPSLVTLFSIASMEAPMGRTTTVMAMMSTGVVVGQSLASAVVGAVVDDFGYHPGFMLISAAGAALVLLGLVHRLAVARRRRRVGGEPWTVSGR